MLLVGFSLKSLRQISNLFFASLCFLLISCGAPAQDNTDQLLAVDEPFGFTWNGFSIAGTDFGPDPIVGCESQLNALEAVIPESGKATILELCINDKYRDRYLSENDVPNEFRDGEISVTLKGRGQPVIFSYSYLHRVMVDPEHIESQRKRKARSNAIDKRLTALYGPPNSSGYFSQAVASGFIASQDGNQPCNLWIVEDIGILLCSERVILIDGIEMSLSFIKLDAVPFGEALRCMANTADSDDCIDQNSGDYEYPNENTFFLDVLSDWLKPGAFRDCDSDTLEPLETAWALTDELQTEVSEITERYYGEELAQYAFENGGELTGGGSESEEQKSMLFFLRTAMEQGSASAMNEIGASLLYCYQNVQQDTSQAQVWLLKAAEHGDILAMRSLARMHMNGMIDSDDGLAEAITWLTKCNEVESSECQHMLRATQELAKIVSQ